MAILPEMFWITNTHIMDNVKFDVKDSKLTIVVDLKQKGKTSKSGKSILIASSNGNIAVAEGTFMGLNVYRK
jgi:hypothetical protein